MQKKRKEYICSECGFKSIKWSGCCANCGGWNSLEEVIFKSNKFLNSTEEKSAKKSVVLKELEQTFETRYSTSIDELDILFGGGIVKGSVSLIGGAPGIGKSTLLLQICNSLCEKNKVLYVSGEESTNQIKLRATRLCVNCLGLLVLSDYDLETVVAEILKNRPQIVIIDSIQTMQLSELSSAAGSVTQIKECTYILQKIAKKYDISIVIVGHVTKEGAIAGPKILEHIVDVVLYFEGDLRLAFRVLRVVKNRFGSTNEIAVFEMVNSGLKIVSNPSASFLEETPKSVSGSCITSFLEGTRPLFAEIQALVVKSGFAVPRRMCKGFDYNRLTLIVAVLEKRAGYFFGSLDCYVNVIGGLKLQDPGVDLAVAMALISSLLDIAICDDIVALGEVGLAGEIRSVAVVEKTIAEAQRLGFKKMIVPVATFKKLQKHSKVIDLVAVKDIKTALGIIFNKNKI